MNAEEFTAKKRLLQGFELLLKNPAWAELEALFYRHQGNAAAGLRNRSSSREKRDEFLQAMEDADELVNYVPARIKGLIEELKAEPEGSDEGE